jgi:AcrR family transcriptional regulator
VSAKSKPIPTPPASERRPAELSGKRSLTRTRILDATFKLIGHEHGLQVRIEEVCALAGVSRGTFYNYFPSMENLFQVLAIELSHDFNQAVVATLEGIEDCAVGTNAAIQHYLKRAQRDPAWGWAMVHLSATGPMLGQESYEACLGTMERGIKAGDFNVPNAQCARDILLGSCLASMVSTLRGQTVRSSPKIIAFHVLRALGVQEERARSIAAQPLPDVLE